MKFSGDIIITDPCYIVKHSKLDLDSCPSWWDFVSKATYTIKTNAYNKEYKQYDLPCPEDYADCMPKPEELLTPLEKIKRIEGKAVMYSPTLDSEWKAYYKAADDYNRAANDIDDWAKSSCGMNMQALGLNTCITRGTIYGDWSCTVFDSDTDDVLGEFCADAGMVGVFLLDEVLSYNPDFDYHVTRPWTTTWIKGFEGHVKFEEICSYDEPAVRVVGRGNVNFLGRQTGL